MAILSPSRVKAPVSAKKSSPKKKAPVPSDSIAGSIEGRKSPAIHHGRQGFINLILFFIKIIAFMTLADHGNACKDTKKNPKSLQILNI